MPVKKENETLNLEELASSAISQGVSIITKNNPKFRGYDWNDYLDSKKISEYTARFEQKLKTVPDKRKEEYIREFYSTLEEYAARGELLNEKGQELILRKSWNKQSNRLLPTKGKREAKELLKGEKQLEGVIQSFKELYDIMATQGYAQRMPEIAHAVSSVYQGGFWDAALNVLYENKKLDKGRYLTLKQALRNKVNQGIGITQMRLEQYLSQAAVIFGGIGLFVLSALLISNTITGNIIGITNSNSFPAIIFGVVSLVSGIFLWSKKKHRINFK